jgi:hypothetical protein
MNAITFSRQHIEEDAIVVHDVGDCIRSWGKRGIISGGLFGFILAATLVAIPLTSDVLTFGIIGTLIVGAVECAVVAGAFGALAAALYGRGVLRGNTTGLVGTLATDRLPEVADWREGDIPLTEWPARWSFPGSSVMQSVLPTTDDYRDIIAPSVQQAQMTMSAIDSWENGGCGP